MCPDPLRMPASRSRISDWDQVVDKTSERVVQRILFGTVVGAVVM